MSKCCPEQKKAAKFSVLIPVYNSEKYLEECIDSVLNQTCQDFEIILVEDGSRDASKSICDICSARDTRIKTIHQQNQGPLSARITAFLEANGEYVIYMDSDDYWNEELLMSINEIFIVYGGDVVSFDFQPMKEDGGIVQKESSLGSGEIAVYDCNQLMVEFLTTEKENSLCKRAVRRELVDKIGLEKLKTFGKLSLGEDMLQTFVMIKDCNKFIHMDKALYYYRKYSESITHSNNPTLIVDVAKARNYLVKIMSETRFGTEEYQRMVETSFLEHYLTDLASLCSIHEINTMKKIAYDIKHMEIYQKSCRNILKRCMTIKRRLLLYLEQREMWRCYWLVSKIYSFKHYIRKGV